MWGEMSGDLKTYQLDNIPPNFPVSPTVGVGDERLTSGMVREKIRRYLNWDFLGK